jgi:hypothetical protein
MIGTFAAPNQIGLGPDSDQNLESTLNGLAILGIKRARHQIPQADFSSCRPKSFFELTPDNAGLADDRLQRADANFSVIGYRNGNGSEDIFFGYLACGLPQSQTFKIAKRPSLKQRAI